jgi:ubiquinone/menaquinone biosynthesis C-methylase UbiE
MSVAAHLGIDLAEYDASIRTFIPDYEEMLDVAAAAVPRDARTIVDAGTGTGALAARCLRRVPRARVLGVDEDPDILAVAARRLGKRSTFITGSFVKAPLPRCDAIVASLSLHHVRSLSEKAAMYRHFRRALKRRGRLIIVDCYPSGHHAIGAAQREEWKRHLRATYSARKAVKLLADWARDDHYVALDREVALIARAGFAVDIVWRKGSFAVLVASPQ